MSTNESEMICHPLKIYVSWLFLLIFLCQMDISATFEPMEHIQYNPAIRRRESLSKPTSRKPLKVAVCYWGLTRSTRKVYRSHYKNFFNILKQMQIQYDVFMHTWEIHGKQRVWEKEIDSPVDYNEYTLLKPTYYQIDRQDDFTDALEFDQYFYEGIDGKLENQRKHDWPPEKSEKLLLNHLCALESLKRVTEMVESTENGYDLVVYIRPDVRLKSKFPAFKINNIKDDEILIPNFGHFGGYNDRFAVLTSTTAPIYGKRIDGLAEFRRTQGHITSERYVKYTCDINNLNTTFINFHFDIIRP